MKRTLANGVIWDDVDQIGYFPVDIERQPYDAAYFEKYEGYASTMLGRDITRARIDLVRRHVPDADIVVDVGIGSGQFCSTRKRTFGYDVNPHGIGWLLGNEQWWDPWYRDMPNATFWDSLEHFKDPREILAKCRGFAFISIPIFDGPGHIERSKHFKEDEHFWYFTHDSLVKFMSSAGFVLDEASRIETTLGREDIGTFAFHREHA